MSAAIAALIRINAWGEGVAPVTAGATSTAAQALPTGALKVAMKVTQRCHVIFGAAAVAEATTSSFPLTPGVDYVLDIANGVTHYRALRADSTDAVVNVVRCD